MRAQLPPPPPACLSILRTPKGERRSRAAIWRRLNPSPRSATTRAWAAVSRTGRPRRLPLARVGQAGAHPLDDEVPPKLREGTDHVEEQPAHGRGGVDRLAMANEVHAKVAVFLECCDQGAEGAGKAVILPNKDAIEAAPAHVATSLVHVLAMHCKAAAGGIVAQLAQLEFRTLLARGHPGIDRHPHRPAAAPVPCSRAQYYRFVLTRGRLANSLEMLGTTNSDSEGFSVQPYPLWSYSLPFHRDARS